MKRHLFILTACVFMLACTSDEKSKDQDDSKQSAVQEGAAHQKTGYLGLWVTDQPMQKASKEFQDAVKDNPNIAEMELPPHGYMIEDKVWLTRQGTSPARKQYDVESVEHTDGVYRFTLVKRSGRKKTKLVRLEDQFIIVSEGATDQYPDRFRRCDSTCQKKMDAGDKTLF